MGANLIWSAVMFIITVQCASMPSARLELTFVWILRDLSDSYIKICDLIEEISLCLERYSACVEALGVTALLKSRLVNFYDDVLLFYLEVAKFHSRSRKAALGVSIWKGLQAPFDDIEKKIQKHSVEIERAFAVEHITLTTAGFDNTDRSDEDTKGISAGLFMVPDMLSPWFTGRVSQLQELNKLTASSSAKRVAIYGMPGVGKTQLLLQFAAESRNAHPEANVFFVDATEKENLVQDFQKVHRILRLPREPHQEVMIEAVKQWLVQHDKWLLLVDNVVRADIVRPFLPAGDRGIIIYTTRSEACARSMGTGKLQLLPFSRDESVALIFKATDVDIETASDQAHNVAAELSRLLGDLPLALEQSAACVADRHWTLSGYLEKLRSSRIETLSLGLAPDSIHLNVFDTFRFAMRQLLPTSVALMKVMAHLDHHSIPMKLLRLGIKCNMQNVGKSPLAINVSSSPQVRHHIHLPYKHRFGRITQKLNPKRFGHAKSDHDRSCRVESILESLKALFSDDNALETAVSSVAASALVNRKEDGTIWMHDLVCDLSLEEIWPEEHSVLAELAVTICYYAFPLIPENHETWEDCEEIATHALVSLSHVSDGKAVLTSASNLQFLLGLFYQARGRYNDALQFYKAAATTFEKTLGPEHIQTLTTINSIANLLDDQGKYEESLHWHEVALAAREKALGATHPDTLSTVNNMAASFRKQGKYDKAMSWYLRAFAGFEKVLNDEHPDTLSTISNIANVFHEQGKYKEALQWHRRALVGRAKKLGHAHPQTLSTMNNMATSLSRQGKDKQVLQLYHNTLENFERLLGHDHPHTLSVCNNIAIALHNLGEHKEALHWHERALTGRQKVLGIENPDTLSSLDNTANVLDDLGDNDQASQNHQRALTGRQKLLGQNHPETLCTVNNIGVSFINVTRAQFPQAMQWCQAALDGFLSRLGPDHPFTLTAMYNIGVICDHRGEYEQSRSWYTKALVGREKMLGEHPDTVSTVLSLVSVMKREGRTDEASRWYANAVARLRQSAISDSTNYLPTDIVNVEDSVVTTGTDTERRLPLSEPASGDQVAAPRPQALNTYRLLIWCSNRIQWDSSIEDNRRDFGMSSGNEKEDNASH